MAAFPFGWNPPSLGIFVEKCTSDFGCELIIMDYEVEGSFGVATPRLLKREVDGVQKHVVLPNLPDDVLISLHLVANMCRRLEIPTEAFGFVFDYESGSVEVR